MANKCSDLTDDLLINLLFTEGDRLSREVIDEIVRRGDAVVDPLTWLVMDVRAWRAEQPAQWAPIHATFALGAIGGENTLLGLLTAAEHAEAYACEPVISALPAIFGRIGPSARPFLSERLRDQGRRTGFRAIMAQCLAATALPDTQGADAVLGEMSAVSAETDNVALKDAVERVLTELRGTWDGEHGPDRSRYEQDWLARYVSEDSVGRRTGESPVSGTEVELGESQSESEPIAQVTRRQPKIGRNAVCPCGSGKKYKKCCLDVDAVLEPLGI
jgi:hypothetical protein